MPKKLGRFFFRGRFCVCFRHDRGNLRTKLDDAGDNLAYAGDPRIFIDFLFRRKRICIASAVAETCRQPVVSLSLACR